MKLNSDIICQRLRKKYSIDYLNPGRCELLLSQPEIYINNINHFYENRVYLATIDHLPQRPVIEKNVLLICIGSGTLLNYYAEHATVILIRKKVDFYEVYQDLRDLFDTFSEWESRTLAMYMKTPSVQDILDQASEAFFCPIIVLDSAFHYVASINAPAESLTASDMQQLPLSQFQIYLQSGGVRLDQHGVFSLKLDDGIYICVNLFSADDEYIGCLYIDKSMDDFLKGEMQLADYLAKIIEHVCEVNPTLINHAHSSLKQILISTIYNRPLSKAQKTILQTANRQTSYRCVSIHSMDFSTSLPVSYLCSVLENLFPKSIFFGYQETLLGLVPEELIANASSNADPLHVFRSLLQEMHLQAGISNSFRDLYMLRTYYMQADCAIENGHLYGPNDVIHHFSTYALTELVTNAINNQPVEVYFPKGFEELLEHDRSGDVSYLDTLRVFLNENMSYTKASRVLYIHRSTLVERIERIQKTLSVNLEDPDQRLQLQILLKAIQLNKQADLYLASAR